MPRRLHHEGVEQSQPGTGSPESLAATTSRLNVSRRAPPKDPPPRVNRWASGAIYPVSARPCPACAPVGAPRDYERVALSTLQGCGRRLTEATSICRREAAQMHDAEVGGHGADGCRPRCRLAQRLVRSAEAHSM